MPLNTKGRKILTKMKKNYGQKKGKQVFYSSINKGDTKVNSWKKKMAY